MQRSSLNIFHGMQTQGGGPPFAAKTMQVFDAPLLRLPPVVCLTARSGARSFCERRCAERGPFAPFAACSLLRSSVSLGSALMPLSSAPHTHAYPLSLFRARTGSEMTSPTPHTHAVQWYIFCVFRGLFPPNCGCKVASPFSPVTF